MKYLVDARWYAPHGIGRFAREVISRLDGAVPIALSIDHRHPLNPIFASIRLWQLRPQVYFSPGFNPPLWSAVPFVFTIGDLIHLRFPGEAGLGLRAYYRFIVAPAARRAHRVLTFSEFSKAQIVEAFSLPENRVTVVGCGVGPEFSPEGKKHVPGYPYILYVGNHRKHKNLPRMFEAFARANRDPHLRLVVSGNMSEHLASDIQRLGLERRVVFAGVIPDDLLPSYYRGALALVYPSLYEGFGLPPLEAMASGIPVVTSNVTSIPEVVGDAAVSVDPYDVDAIAEGIRKVVGDNSLRKRLQDLGLERAGAFTWDRTAAIVQHVLQEAIASGV